MVNTGCISTKAKLLSVLREMPGKKMSGSSLAKELGISRVSIWKAAHELSSMGYSIQADKTGYAYASCDEDFLLPVEFGDLEPLITYTDITTSTMNLAEHYASKGAAHGSIFIAEEQTAGRGRKNRQWISRRGNLQFTLLIRPQQSFTCYYTYILRAQLALANVVYAICPQADVSIKWPNDVFISNKKVAGILAEGMILGDEFSWLALGIGLNVKSAINEKGTICLSDVCHTLPPRAFILKQFVTKFNELISNSNLLVQYEKQFARWKKSSLCSIKLSDGTIKKGKILKIDQYGQLHFCPGEQQHIRMVFSPADASIEV